MNDRLRGVKEINDVIALSGRCGDGRINAPGLEPGTR
jgi:hypothetical protein